MVEIFPYPGFNVLNIVDDVLQKLGPLILGDGYHHLVLKDHLVQRHGDEGQSEEGDDAGHDVVGNQPNAEGKSVDDQPDGL